MEELGKYSSRHTKAQYACFYGFSPVYLGVFEHISVDKDKKNPMQPAFREIRRNI